MSLFHHHKWYAIDVQQGTYLQGIPGHDWPAWTLVMMRCATCSAAKTRQLQGRWTLEQVKA